MKKRLVVVGTSSAMLALAAEALKAHEEHNVVLVCGDDMDERDYLNPCDEIPADFYPLRAPVALDIGEMYMTPRSNEPYYRQFERRSRR